MERHPSPFDPEFLTTQGQPTCTKQQHRPSEKINVPRLRTKVCRSYQRGLPCPFGNDCVFAHVDLHEWTGTTSADADNSGSDTNGQGESESQESLSGNQRSSIARTTNTTGPPSYSESIKQTAPPPAYTNAILTPPPYPLRYRHDPYSYAGIIFL